ncbi:hypothetical protein JCM19294_99 [Nonlabens tegetincola]|uniref:Uncharacterized protein n=1 Tax=Nonlabens tegetincola TaxID=323273 RepID=A0A090Q738_9FLAO|nr:hypothetical protein JCM19294_99 [Nonlabens tegetincola]
MEKEKQELLSRYNTCNLGLSRQLNYLRKKSIEARSYFPFFQNRKLSNS